MRKSLGWTCAIAWIGLCLYAQNTTPAKKKTSSASKKAAAGAAPASKKPAAGKTPKKTTSSKGTAASKKGAAPSKTTSASKAPAKKTASAKSGKKKPVTTWRNRQTVPAPERYKEIQDALAAKGYLSAEDATGGWGSNSVDALKRFQAVQNLEVTGKINSLSLIALGLGPRHDAPPAAKPAETPLPPAP
jgi:hypothetical protein